MDDWQTYARCREPDAPSPFPDDWGTGLIGRAKRSQALSRCRSCPVKRECGLQALAEFDSGLELYGIRGGVVFTDVILQRQERDVALLRRMIAA